MLIADLPPNVTRTYNKVQARWDAMAEVLRENKNYWLQGDLASMPGAHLSKRKRVQTRVRDAMEERGLRVTTRTDTESIFVRFISEIEVGK